MNNSRSGKRLVFRLIIGGSVVIVIGGIVMALFYFGLLRMNYPSQRQFPVHGIDISHHQQTIQWEQLSQERVDFVFMKATEGGDFKDTRFLQNWRNAQRVSIPRGAYHFFTFCRSGATQAANFIDTVPVEPQTLPPVIDLEFGGNCQARPSSDALEQELRDFVVEIERVYHRSPLLYVTYEAYEAYIKGKFEHLEIWIRDIFWTPELSDYRPWRVWQYSNRGRVRGIPTYVDLNVFSGSKEAFQQLIQ